MPAQAGIQPKGKSLDFRPRLRGDDIPSRE